VVISRHGSTAMIHHRGAQQATAGRAPLMQACLMLSRVSF
jgi:hypothetical protein